MRFPGERGDTVEKIRGVAEEGKTFERFDFIRKWFGIHTTEDWQECLDELVATGELQVVGQVAERKTYQLVPRIVYKQVAIRNGRYYSCFVGVPGASYLSWEKDYPALEYQIGQTTSSSTERGIFCIKDKDNALDRAKARRDMWTTAGEAAVLECQAIGEFSYPCNYLAVKVIREIWRETPKFEVGNRVRVRLDVEEPTHAWGYVEPGDVGVISKFIGENFYVDFLNQSEWLAKPSEMELAPEPIEKWVDVTEGCTAKVMSDRVIISHEGEELGVIGIEPFASFTRAKGYKIEGTGSGYSPKVQCARILKQVTK